MTLLWLLFQPERINPELNQKGYNVKSDVWSLGITMVRPGAPLLVGWSTGGGCARSVGFWGPDSLAWTEGLVGFTM